MLYLLLSAGGSEETVRLACDSSLRRPLRFVGQ